MPLAARPGNPTGGIIAAIGVAAAKPPLKPAPAPIVSGISRAAPAATAFVPGLKKLSSDGSYLPKSLTLVNSVRISSSEIALLRR
jgi:hypothetical protein